MGFAVTLTNVSDEFDAALKDLAGKLTQIESVMDLDALRAQVADLEQQASSPTLWDDPEAAQKVTSQLSHRQGELRRVSDLRQRLDDLGVLYELAEAEGDSGSMSEAEAGLRQLGMAIDRRGRLYAVETSVGKPIAPPFLFPATGRVVRIEDDGSLTPLANALDFPTALAFDPRDGALYVSVCGYGCPAGSGAVLRIAIDE